VPRLKPQRYYKIGTRGCFAILLFTYGLIFLGADFWTSKSRATTPASISEGPDAAQFIGSAKCVACHSRDYAEWESSQHGVAMQEANDKTVLGRFDGAISSHGGVTSTFFRKGAQFWVRTDGSDGQLTDFQVRYTFGVLPLQQYLIELPKGHLQALGIAWDTRSKEKGGQRWFHLYPNRKLKPGDPLHWTGIDQNWNYQCAFCHSTDLKKNYDTSSNSFHTTWSEISVGCEACHGPASRHVAWASKTGDWQRADVSKGFASAFDERKGIIWSPSASGTAVRSQPRSTDKEIEVCAQCHARRQQFSNDVPPGHRFLDAFRPSLLEPGAYYADGQQREEDYNYASFLESRMYAAGVTCSDCHNPHTGKLRASGNAVCTQCHAPEKYSTPAHHHHVEGSKGAACAACHMPTTTYMVVDPRHDHSIRIPRPDRTYFLGTPNACNQCHVDKSATWATEAIKSWYPSPKTGYQSFAEAFDLADRAAPGAQAALMKVVEDSSQSAIARASAVARLGHFLSPKSLSAVTTGLRDADAKVRMGAIGALADAEIPTRLTLLPPLLVDEARVVRMEAARALAGEAEQALKPEDRRAFEAAIGEYIDSQKFNAERPESQLNLGSLYMARGQFAEAEAALKKAIDLDPTFIAAPIALAELQRTQGSESAAETTLRQAFGRNPNAAALLHALGLSLVRQKRTEEALTNLTEAAKLAPEEARFAYVAGVALHDSGKSAEGVEMLEATLMRHPYDRDILFALVSYELEAGNDASARSHAELLRELEPDSEQVAQLLATIQRRAR
jgi:predicted CXXCH cytochrome family protein